MERKIQKKSGTLRHNCLVISGAAIKYFLKAKGKVTDTGLI